MTRHPLHIRLREATKGLHRCLDHHPLLATLVRPTVTLDAYGKALTAMRGPQAWMEEWVAQAADNVDEIYAPRLDALDRDLSDLGRLPGVFVCDRMDTSLPALVGVLYVLEGSRRGGTFIGKMILEHLPGAPCRFLCADETEAESWHSVWSLADKVSHQEYDLTLEAAVRCFSVVLKQMEASTSEFLTHE